MRWMKNKCQKMFDQSKDNETGSEIGVTVLVKDMFA